MIKGIHEDTYLSQLISEIGLNVHCYTFRYSMRNACHTHETSITLWSRMKLLELFLAFYIVEPKHWSCGI